MKKPKDYYKKKYKNPHLRDRAKDRVRARQIIFFIFLFVLIYIFFFSPIFRLQEIEVSETKSISRKEVITIFESQAKKRRFLILPQSNILFFSKKTFIDSLQTNLFIETITIKKHYFQRKISVFINENSAQFVWITQSRAFYVDATGEALSEIKGRQVQNDDFDSKTTIIRHKIVTDDLAIVYDVNDTKVSIGDNVLLQNEIIFINELIHVIDRYINFEISFYNFDLTNRTITAVTSEGWEIRFSIDDNSTVQMKNVELLLRETIKDTSQLEYIDVRFGDQVYYK